MGYRLGLDMGTNSIGWAAVEEDDKGELKGILDMGARIFPDGRNPQDKSSLALQRRVPRGARRRRDRYLERREDLLEMLAACGLMPPDPADRKALEALNPYRLRARALDAPLTPHELGRALFHLNQRRGFKSNRKAKPGDENEDKKAREDIAELRKSITASGSRTLGEFLWRRHEQSEPLRSRPGLGLYPERSMYEYEFDAIRAAQGEHHAIRPEQWDALRETIFYQRPLRPVLPGPCLLEEGERRAPRALPVAQEFRMAQEVNNLRIQRDIRDRETALDAAERERVLQHLRRNKELTFVRMRKLLDLPEEARINMEQWGRKGLKGDETGYRLASKELFGGAWWEFAPEKRAGIARALLETEDPVAVKEKAMAEWGLKEAAAAKLALTSLPDGHLHLSEKAINKVLPHLLETPGLSWADAASWAGYHHSDRRPDDPWNRLPYYGAVLQQEVTGAVENPPPGDDPARYGRIANPTVHIGLNQLRQVVNELIDRYGKPERIVVELARDLKLNQEQRQRVERENREGQARNARLREDIEGSGGKVSAEALLKLRLWEEQGPKEARCCPYTGKTISFGMIMSAETEIDHILPLSRTLDDSGANKVVCLASANREKGDRTPYEAYGHDSERYEAMLVRARRFRDNKNWRFGKDAMERFEGDRDFLDRQLNENMYLSRIARRYLAHLYDEKAAGRSFVQATPGRLTAALRYGWGLNNLTKDGEAAAENARKSRDDHRHHAVDAFVVGCTSPKLLRDISTAAGRHHEASIGDIAKEAKPWQDFDRQEAAEAISRIVVSHKPDQGTPGSQGMTTGQLHDATAFGFARALPADKAVNGGRPRIVQADVVVRKALSAVKTRADLDAVRDGVLRKALQGLWDRVALEAGKASGDPGLFAARAWQPGVPLGKQLFKVRSVRVVETNARVVAMVDRDGKPYKGYRPNSNAFADIWEMPPWPYRLPDGEKKPRIKPGEQVWRMVVVSTFEANQPDFDPAKLRPHPGARHIARLHKDDMCALGTESARQIFRIRKYGHDGGGLLVHIDPHNEANVDGRIRQGELKTIKKSAEQLRKEGFRKVKVNAIGKVLDAGPLRTGGAG